MPTLGREARHQRRHWLAKGVALLLLAALAPHAPAAAIRHTELPDPQEMETLDNFLDKGPQYWRTHALPTVPAGISIVNSNGSLRSDLFVAYLQWRWESHPALFDERHPHVGSALTAAAKAGAIDPTGAAAALTVPSSSTVTADVMAGSGARGNGSAATIDPEAQLLNAPAAVPEPSSAAVTLVLAAGAAWWWRRAARYVRN